MENYGIKVIYDDRKEFPWLLTYYGKVFAGFRTLEAAKLKREKLIDVVNTYLENR